MSNSADFNAERAAPVTSLALGRLVRSPAALVENLPIGVYTCDREGLLVQYNRRAAGLWGRSPPIGDPNFRYCGSFKVFDRDGAELAPGHSPMAHVLRTAQPIRDRELIIEQESGERLTILANVDPLLDEHGKLVGGVNCFQDISELKRVRGQVSEGRRVGRRVMEALPAAIYTTDATGKLLYFNEAAERLWGYRPELGSAYWCGSWKAYRVDGAALPLDQCPMALTLKEKHPRIGPEIVVERPDGKRVHCMPHPTPIFDSKGEMIGAVNMLIDLSDQKRADTQQRGLIDELNHRVKNTLATIQSLAAHTMRGSRNPGDKDFESRLLTLSRAHDELTRHSWEWADFAVIANDTFAPYRGSANNNVHLDGPLLHLKPKSALALAMVLHELASNAVKHGALSTPAGSLTVHWRIDGNTLLVDWREKGGPAVVPPRMRGFGTRLIERSIVHELGGTLKIEYVPTGLHCIMEILLPE